MEAIRVAAEAYAKPSSFRPSYGTAGFRAEASLLPSTVFRCGVLMAVRAIKLQSPTGICITASHNPPKDNGVKLVEPSGEMLTQEWEPYADELAGAESTEAFLASLTSLLRAEGMADFAPTANSPSALLVLIGHDTRPSSPGLAQAAAAGVEALGLAVRMVGEVTTPQLHWLVARTGGDKLDAPPAEAEYYAELARAYAELVGPSGTTPLDLVVDCANGVGAPKLERLLAQLGDKSLRLHLVNTATDDAGALNNSCGADFVQKARRAPAGMAAVSAHAACCSLDGDADRLVFFVPSQREDSVRLLDGDRIAALAAMYVADLAAVLSSPRRHGGDRAAPSIGVVQTAYANGASTEFIADRLGLPIVVTPTGVKHLHAAAHRFDIGIYFEANGHGTVLFSKPFLAWLENVAGGGHGDEQPAAVNDAVQGAASDPCVAAARSLLSLARLINQAVGDALSNLLLVLLALRCRDWGLAQWADLYSDLPSRQSVHSVPDRTVIKTQDAERCVASPPGLQSAIAAAVARVPSGRAFVRPSGTEDVVRVYAEAATQPAADGLADAVGKLVVQFCGGRL